MNLVSRVRRRISSSALGAALSVWLLMALTSAVLLEAGLIAERERRLRRATIAEARTLAARLQAKRAADEALTRRLAAELQARDRRGEFTPDRDLQLAEELLRDIGPDVDPASIVWIEILDSDERVISSTWRERVGLSRRAAPTVGTDDENGHTDVPRPMSVSVETARGTVEVELTTTGLLPFGGGALVYFPWQRPEALTLVHCKVASYVEVAGFEGRVGFCWSEEIGGGGDRRAREWLWGSLGLGLVAAWLLGRNLGQRAGRPIGDLMEAVDAIARGDADFDFDYRTDDEVEELRARFSRLRRAYETEARRAKTAEVAAAWRDVARRVAHEVKNPLAPIRLTIDNLRRARERAPDRFEEMFAAGSTTILEEVDRLDRLVREFSEFARMPPPDRREGSLVDAVAAAVQLYRSERTDVRDTVEGTPRPLPLDRDQVERAIGNLIKNGLEAQPDAAAARVDVSVVFGEQEAVVTVADRGPGFGGEGTGRALEPYYTTKEHGTGLGLAIVHSVVEAHGGWIELAERDGGGAIVRVGWPFDAAADASTGAAPAITSSEDR